MRIDACSAYARTPLRAPGAFFHAHLLHRLLPHYACCTRLLRALYAHRLLLPLSAAAWHSFEEYRKKEGISRWKVAEEGRRWSREDDSGRRLARREPEERRLAKRKSGVRQAAWRRRGKPRKGDISAKHRRAALLALSRRHQACAALAPSKRRRLKTRLALIALRWRKSRAHHRHCASRLPRAAPSASASAARASALFSIASRAHQRSSGCMHQAWCAPPPRLRAHARALSAARYSINIAPRAQRACLREWAAWLVKRQRRRACQRRQHKTEQAGGVSTLAAYRVNARRNVTAAATGDGENQRCALAISEENAACGQKTVSLAAPPCCIGEEHSRQTYR